MTTGQLLFYSGLGLLGMTILLAIVFAIKRPVYSPENAVDFEEKTEPLRNGYPTDRLLEVDNRPPEDTTLGTVLMQTEIMEEETELLNETEKLTELLQSTEHFRR